ncbi:Zn-ribbon domain-containing OB-fold protein [Streptomyces gilvus]|uniref:Zn-ribbon domain-containing OB-fold protein n=1 Tax=Streptomyces gilvus TaxID=2920937 RepID=UPI001F0DF973|nr:OB-fold domain-containing protein [Streptomyces sp. CME 23]MCH5675612.1 OB-fold domain-containing protein [Streptomyces sp. CME 23]
MGQIPLVDYLVLGDEPRLVANECTSCGARYFDRRNACARCGRQEFETVDVSRTGTLRSFTIVHFAAKGVDVPFVAGVVDCAGTIVSGNVVNVPPDPRHVSLGMDVRLTTVPVGTDTAGVMAVGFGFEPVAERE